MPFVPQFLDVLVISPTRLRLLFNAAPTVDAFGNNPTTGQGYKLFGPGVPPSTWARGALAVPGSYAVEVVFANPLPVGVPLTIQNDGVYLDNGAGGSQLAAPASLTFRVSPSPTVTNAEVLTNNAELALYGRDLVWTGADYEETATGDLARVSGVANVEAALLRRLTGAPLPWAPNYSPRARDFVDGADSGPLRGRILRQALRDNRVRRVNCVVRLTSDGTAAFFDVGFTLRGGEAPPSLSVAIEN